MVNLSRSTILCDVPVYLLVSVFQGGLRRGIVASNERRGQMRRAAIVPGVIVLFVIVLFAGLSELRAEPSAAQVTKFWEQQNRVKGNVLHCMSETYYLNSILLFDSTTLQSFFRENCDG